MSYDERPPDYSARAWIVGIVWLIIASLAVLGLLALAMHFI